METGGSVVSTVVVVDSESSLLHAAATRSRVSATSAGRMNFTVGKCNDGWRQCITFPRTCSAILS